MGLDITAYQRIDVLPPHERSDACWEEEDHQPTLVYPGMEQSFRGLPIVSRKDDGIAQGPCVRVSGESIGFRAGSYSGYGEFRRALCKAALGVAPEVVWTDPEGYRTVPFFELINFSDCEGTIGPEACADLAEDFGGSLRDQIRTRLSIDDPWFVERYDLWQRAFELAASTGIVSFH